MLNWAPAATITAEFAGIAVPPASTRIDVTLFRLTPALEISVYEPVGLVNEIDCAETLEEMLTVPSALPVKLAVAVVEFGTPAGDQLMELFQLLLAPPTQV